MWRQPTGGRAQRSKLSAKIPSSNECQCANKNRSSYALAMRQCNPNVDYHLVMATTPDLKPWINPLVEAEPSQGGGFDDLCLMHIQTLRPSGRIQQWWCYQKDVSWTSQQLHQTQLKERPLEYNGSSICTRSADIKQGTMQAAHYNISSSKLVAKFWVEVAQTK